jgi:hypothetical protein
MLTEAQAAALNEDVLKYSAVEWREVEEGRGGREALGRAVADRRSSRLRP